VESVGVEEPVVDAVVVVAWVVVGGDEIDAGGCGGVAGVPVHVAHLGAGEEFAGVPPGVAVVAGHEGALVVVDGAGEAVQAAVEFVEVRIGHAGPAGVGAPVEGLLGSPVVWVVGFADAPTGEVVGLVAGVHREPAAVGTVPEGGHVVVVGFESLVEDDDVGGAGGEVDDRDLDVAAAALAVDTGGRGDRPHEEEAGDRIDECAFVLEPAPGGVVVDDDRCGAVAGGWTVVSARHCDLPGGVPDEATGVTARPASAFQGVVPLPSALRQAQGPGCSRCVLSGH
jgi:hypothetical protein